jgi:hypothetical protein
MNKDDRCISALRRGVYHPDLISVNIFIDLVVVREK